MKKFMKDYSSDELSELTNDEIFELIDRQKAFESKNKEGIDLIQVENKPKEESVRLFNSKRDLTKEESILLFKLIETIFYAEKIDLLAEKQLIAIHNIVNFIKKHQEYFNKEDVGINILLELENLFTIFIISSVELRNASIELSQKLKVEGEFNESSEYILFCHYRDFLAHGNRLLVFDEEQKDIFIDLSKIRLNLTYEVRKNKKPPLDKVSIDNFLSLTLNFFESLESFLDNLYIEISHIHKKIIPKIDEIKLEVEQKIYPLTDISEKGLKIYYNKDYIDRGHTNDGYIKYEKENNFVNSRLENTCFLLSESKDELEELKRI